MTPKANQLKIRCRNCNSKHNDSRNVITAKRGDITRKGLQTAAMAMGRSAEQVTKASTMRLAFWASVGKSAI